MKLVLDKQITITGANPEIVSQLKKEFSFPNPKFEEAQRHGRWTGKIDRVLCFCEESQGSVKCPRGAIRQVLNIVGRDIVFQDRRPTLPEINFKFTGELRSYQDKALQDVLGKDFGVLEAFMGSGKCHGKNTPVIMYDGIIKMVQDIRVGDFLMGPDSKPKKVLNITTGRGPMYKVIPVKGTVFTCNGDHVLSLKCTATTGKEGITYKKNRITNISVDKYFKQSNCFKNVMKLWRVGVDFPEKVLPVDPYMVGIYLGDGLKTRSACITTGDQDIEVIEYIKNWAKSNGFKIREEPGKNCVMRFIITRKGQKNPFLDFTKTLVNSKGERIIPKKYLINSRENRLKLLAGLIDTDGHYSRMAVYDLVFKDKKFVEQVAFLARSLGFAANISKKEATIKSLNFKGIYWRLCISGNLDEISCKVARKKATHRKQIKNHLRTGFSIEAIGDGDYYGFNLNGDHLYLLGDFTVTHNTVMALAVIAARRQPTLILVHSKLLLYQWQDRITKFLGVSAGLVGDGRFDIQPITIAIANTAQKRLLELFEHFGQIIVDECSIVPSTMFSSVVRAFDCKYMLGLSATPYRNDGLTNLIYWFVGNRTHLVDREELQDSGAVLIPKICTRKTDFTYTKIITFMIEDEGRNGLIVRDIIRETKSHAGTILVVSDRIEHCNILVDLLRSASGKALRVKILTGQIKPKERTPLVKDVLAGRVDVLMATVKLLEKGFDCEGLFALFLATPIKFSGRLIQVIGRILRPKDGKKPKVYDYQDPVFGSARAREKVYKEMGWIVDEENNENGSKYATKNRTAPGLFR